MKKKAMIGDILYRSKSVFEHAGVLIDQDLVMHNKPGCNVHYSSVDDYAEGKTVKVVSSHLQPKDQEALKEKAKHLVNKKSSYSVPSFNCEHFASLLIKGKAESPQVQGTVIGAVLGAAWAQCSNPKHTLTYTAIGALLGCIITNASRKYDYNI